jgi:hypothetical protein
MEIRMRSEETDVIGLPFSAKNQPGELVVMKSCQNGSVTNASRIPSGCI